MASLDGYSLNEKIDKVKSDVTSDLENLKIAFGQLYQYVETLGENQKKLISDCKCGSKTTKPKGKKNEK